MIRPTRRGRGRKALVKIPGLNLIPSSNIKFRISGLSILIDCKVAPVVGILSKVPNSMGESLMGIFLTLVSKKRFGGGLEISKLV
jgi:hypothetical protein